MKATLRLFNSCSSTEPTSTPNRTLRLVDAVLRWAKPTIREGPLQPRARRWQPASYPLNWALFAPLPKATLPDNPLLLQQGNAVRPDSAAVKVAAAAAAEPMRQPVMLQTPVTRAMMRQRQRVLAAAARN